MAVTVAAHTSDSRHTTDAFTLYAVGVFFEESMEDMIEELRDKALKLCAEHGITVQPYAGGWWLRSNTINRVVGEIAGLCLSKLSPVPVMNR